MSDRCSRTAVLAVAGMLSSALAVTAVGTPAGALEPELATFAPGVQITSASGDVAVADINGDTVPDFIATGPYYAPHIAVSLGLGGGAFAPPLTSPAGTGFEEPVAVDVNDDDLVDVVGLDTAGNRVVVALGDGTGYFGALTHYPTSTNPVSLDVGDFDGDTDVDLAIANVNGNSVSVLLGEGDGTFATATGYPQPARPTAVAVGDVDGDAVPDLVVAAGDLQLMRGNGDGTFGAPTSLSIAADTAVELLDLDGDGDLDVATTRSGAGRVVAAMGDGSGGFSVTLYTTLTSLSCQCAVSAGDLNGDDVPDLVVTTVGTPNGVGVLLGRGDGTFTANTNFEAPTNDTVAIPVDLNADGLTDLVVPSNTGTSILLNRPGLPQPPTMGTALGGLRSATVTWTPASPGASPITGYVVTPYRATGYGVPLPSTTFDATTTTRTISGLTNGQRYMFRVAAINALGTGQKSLVWSNSVLVGQVPAAPTIGTATAGNGQATVRWTAPVANGGPAVTGYRVTPYVGYYAFPPVVFTGTATTRTVTGLTNGTTYRFKVVAVNAVGVGAMSTASNAVTPFAPTAPAAPTIGAATAGNTTAVVTWTAPSSDGGSAITGYVVTPYIGAVAQPPRTYFSPGTTQTITGLANGVTYTFTVAATNAVGTGAASAPSNAVTPQAVVPSAPAIGAVVAGSGEATVSWTAPASNGGAPITGYRVTPFIGYFPLASITFSSTSTTQVVFGLTNGTTYRFKVAAINSAGTGPTSLASGPVTPSA